MTLRVHYHPTLLARARAGKHNFTERLRSAMAPRGVDVELCEDTFVDRAASAARPGHSLVLMQPPLSKRQLCLRLAYLFPFWRIERKAERWEFDIARAAFDPAAIDSAAAAAFCQRRRAMHLDGIAPGQCDGAVYVPLQGRIRENRSFQTMSPMDMLAATLAQTGDAPVVAGLHPNESYDAADMAALDALAIKSPRLTVVKGDMNRLLSRAPMVVTQNSSVALMGYFLHKPTVLFGRIDFHHIAANVDALGVAQAFDFARAERPDYERYLYWFFRHLVIDAGASGAEDQIQDAMRRGGWAI